MQKQFDSVLIDLRVERLKLLMVLDHITCLGVVAVDGADFAEMVGVVNAKLAVLNPVVAVVHWILCWVERCFSGLAARFSCTVSRNLTA